MCATGGPIRRDGRLILLLADGCTYVEIRAKLDCSDSFICRWRQRFSSDRSAGLFSRHAGRERFKVTDKLEARVLARTTKHKPADGSTHWSSRKLAAELGGGISHMTVARIWAKHGIKPHRLEGYLNSNDPDFETKAADVIGLYLNPPQNAVVFSVDEKTAIQALDGKDPVLPLSPGPRKTRMTTSSPGRTSINRSVACRCKQPIERRTPACRRAALRRGRHRRPGSDIHPECPMISA